MQPQQVSPEKLFAIIGEQATQLILLREQFAGAVRLIQERDKQIKIMAGALEAMKAEPGTAE